MTTVTGLANATLKLVRVSSTRASEGDPTTLETILVAATKVRFDTSRPGNMLQGDLRAANVVGRIFLDAGVKQDDGNALTPQIKDLFYINGRGPYEATDINGVSDMFALHHWEIDLLDTTSR